MLAWGVPAKGTVHMTKPKHMHCRSSECGHAVADASTYFSKKDAACFQVCMLMMLEHVVQISFQSRQQEARVDAMRYDINKTSTCTMHTCILSRLLRHSDSQRTRQTETTNMPLQLIRHGAVCFGAVGGVSWADLSLSHIGVCYMVHESWSQ